MIKKLKALFGRIVQAKAPDTNLIYIVLPEGLLPADRFEKYENPLDAALKAAGLGFVSGGGTMMSAPDKEGNCTIEWCGVDVDTTDIPLARAFLRTHLPHLGCQTETELEYDFEGLPFIDRYDGENWQLDLPNRKKP